MGNEFFGDGFFDWQFSSKMQEEAWRDRHYDEDRYWGGFSRKPFDPDTYKLPGWAIGPFVKYAGNPILAPAPDKWDCGHFGGGVHNGSVIIKDGLFHYLYRGEFPCTPEELALHPDIDYKCDMGLATSRDGIHFTKDYERTPFLRPGGDERYSFEDVNLVRYGDRYYCFLNRWDWTNINDPSVSGIYVSSSSDLLHWEKHGLAFPNAGRIHRNACVLQNPENEAVRINGKFIMYINDGLIAFSDDLIHWESEVTEGLWPGGEGGFAVTDYNPIYPDAILLFTGGHHTGHFYAFGEVLFHKDRPSKPLEWLPRPVLWADKDIPWEDGFSADGSTPVSYWRDTVFFTGMTRREGVWYAYYGGSEYYTCLATVKDNRELIK